MSRIQNTIKNMSSGMAAYFIKLFTQFWCRRLFVLLLGEVYLGLNGLFSNILMLLSLAELGVGSAITFSLYKPLAENNTEEIKSLMALFKKAYIIIGFVVAAVGMSLTPFLHIFVKDMPELAHIRLIYILYVLNSASSYFFTYKRTLIIADQKAYISTNYNCIFSVLMNIFQIVFLYISGSFIVYLITMIAFTVLENVFISLKANRLYPFLKDKNAQKLPKDKLHTIKTNVTALVYHQIGRVVVNGTDNLIMARMIDLVSVGIYSNYMMISGALNSIVGSFYSGVFASIGNMNATESDETKTEIFERINFFSHWISGFCFVCLFCLYNHFMRIWLGGRMLFPQSVVFVISLNFLVYGFRNPVLITKNAMGLYWNDRYKPIAESLINLTVSIALAFKFGIAGILWGTVISSLTTNFWVEPLMLYRHGLHAPLKGYFLRYGKSLIIIAAALIPCWLICALIPGQGIAAFILKGLLCAALTNIIFAALNFRDKNFRYFVGLAGELMKKLFRR